MSSRIFPAEPDKDCSLCPRLLAFREEIKRKEPDWYNGAVPSIGPESAELLIIGLAPGLHGANRTGKPFTGDMSGDLLFKTLSRSGFLKAPYKEGASGKVRLHNTMITNAVRCVPPQNKPVSAEIRQCQQFLKARLAALPQLKTIVMLGRVAHDVTVRTLGLRLKEAPFAHGAIKQAEFSRRKITLISSYHCSRYNVNTKRLTSEMFQSIFTLAKSTTETAK